MSIKLLSRLVLMCGGSLIAATAAHAQQAEVDVTSPPSDGEELREIVVTGTQIQGAKINDVLPVTVVDGVAEWDRESSEYVPIEELKAANDPRWHAMMRGEWNAEETPEEFRDRVVRAVDALIDAHPGQRIAVSCHGGVINAYLAHVLGLPVSNGFFYPNYTSIHRIAASRSGHRSIVTVNETSHLRGTGLPMGMLQ